MDNPIKMDDSGVPAFQEISIYVDNFPAGNPTGLDAIHGGYDGKIRCTWGSFQLAMFDENWRVPPEMYSG